MPAAKNDIHAREHWGPLYDAIPKSVFATVAWHLANVASGKLDQDGAAVTRFFQELGALGANEIVPADQVARLTASLAKLEVPT